MPAGMEKLYTTGEVVPIGMGDGPFTLGQTNSEFGTTSIRRPMVQDLPGRRIDTSGISGMAERRQSTVAARKAMGPRGSYRSISSWST
jgi:hypothetical protein